MVITYHGLGMVKVTQGDLTAVFNPIGKGGTMKGARFGADLALVSCNHENWNGIEQVTNTSKVPFVVNGPGEYEVGGLYIKGFWVEQDDNGTKFINTAYSLILDGVNLCHLGALSTKEIREKMKEKVGGIDVLFIPIAIDGVRALSPSDAHSLVSELEPSIIVPLWVGPKGEDKRALESFQKSCGVAPKQEEKLTLKKKDLEGKEGELVVLSLT